MKYEENLRTLETAGIQNTGSYGIKLRGTWWRVHLGRLGIDNSSGQAEWFKDSGKESSPLAQGLGGCHHACIEKSS